MASHQKTWLRTQSSWAAPPSSAPPNNGRLSRSDGLRCKDAHEPPDQRQCSQVGHAR
jgi:hypothetical protein